jgi:hypothetical protein
MPIPVVVGADINKLTTLHVPTNVLRRSTFFQKMLDSGFSEASDQKINLPEDDPKAVKKYLYWLSTDIFRYDEDEDKDIVTTWKFADKTGDERYINYIMDCVITAFRVNNRFATTPQVASVYEAGLGKTNLAKFFLKSAVDELLRMPENWLVKTGIEHIHLFGDGLAEMMEDLLKEIVAYKLAVFGTNPLTRPKCDFHSHSQGERCKGGQ